MPIFDYCCEKCGEIWESIEVWPSHAPKRCPVCTSKKFKKIIGTSHIRMDSDSILHSMPDPCPPLEELRGKGTQGFADKPEASRNLGDYTRRKDKYGNTIWLERKKVVFDMKKGGN